MDKKLFTVLIGIALMSFAPANGPLLTWSKLENVEFVEKYVKDVEGYMLFPKFPDDLKKLDGKPVTVEGYVVPVDKSGSSVALSANPYAACFFCGKAGPASVMTVKLKVKNPKYKIDDYIKFTGKLRLNDDDIKEFYYILEEAMETK
jgi:hypothetical protein